jgi:hypothetical protein
MKSFMVSYEAATLLKTPATRKDISPGTQSFNLGNFYLLPPFQLREPSQTQNVSFFQDSRTVLRSLLFGWWRRNIVEVWNVGIAAEQT